MTQDIDPMHVLRGCGRGFAGIIGLILVGELLGPVGAVLLLIAMLVGMPTQVIIRDAKIERLERRLEYERNDDPDPGIHARDEPSHEL